MFEQPPVIAIPPTPPIVAVPSEKPSVVLVAHRPGVARCAGAEVPLARRILPFVAAGMRYPGQADALPAPVTLRFRIDRDGRPLSIMRVAQARPGASLHVDTSDLEPALAASRFAPGERTGCELSFAATTAPLDGAGPDLLYAAFDSPLLRPHLRQIYARFAPAGSDCSLSRLRPRVLVTPDLERFIDRPERVGAMFAFDVGPDGRTRNLRLIRSNGAEAAREIRTAIAGTRYFPRAASHGCVIGFTIGARQRNEDQLRPPPAAEPPTDRCPTLPTALRPIEAGPFPEAFSRRNVEGYAVVRYDVAHWGAVGNVRVEASEPAEVFGQRAAAAVGALSFPPSPDGKRDCTMRMIFRLAD